VTLAAETRAAIRRRPFLREALRAGVVNYAAAARLLDVEGEHSAVVAALGRYAEALPDYGESARETRVTMRSGLGERAADPERESDADDESPERGSVDEREDESGSERGRGTENGGEAAAAPLLRVGDRVLVPEAGTRTAILVTGAVDGRVLSCVLARLVVEDRSPVAAGFAGRALVIVVSRRDGPSALRLVESALETIPD
jgi:hypothetical protein